jgi:hypothetical protein
MIAEKSCWPDENERQPIQAVRGARRTSGTYPQAIGVRVIVRTVESRLAHIVPFRIIVATTFSSESEASTYGNGQHRSLSRVAR